MTKFSDTTDRAPTEPEARRHKQAQHRVYLDAVVGLVVAVCLGIAFSSFELFEWLFEVTREYEDWDLDEILLAVVCAGLGSFVFAIRRILDLRKEIHVRFEAERAAARMAMHDALTGLPNRRLLADRLDKAMEQTRRTGENLAVMIIDVNRFKPVNDLYGHPAGDALLIEIGERLQSKLRAHDTLARIGGDEFAVVQSGLEGPDAAMRLARRLISVMETPFEVENTRVSVGVGIGICLLDGRNVAPQELIRQADVALVRAKKNKHSCFCFHEPEMDSRLFLRATLENELRVGIAGGEIKVLYQPIVDLESGEVAALEALARWRHPERGLVNPDVFIPIAEDSNQIMALSEAVLRQACRDARNWPSNIVVCVNISPLQFANAELASLILEVLEQEHFPPERLEIEVTENALVENPSVAAETLCKLKSAGVLTALDDFGTGYSSLAHLRDLAFDKIKIDRSFITRLSQDPDGASMVRAVLALSNNLDLPAVAEGIEELEDLIALKSHGCRYGQGYLFSRPIPPDEILQMVETIRAEVSPAARQEALAALLA